MAWVTWQMRGFALGQSSASGVMMMQNGAGGEPVLSAVQQLLALFQFSRGPPSDYGLACALSESPANLSNRVANCSRVAEPR